MHGLEPARVPLQLLTVAVKEVLSRSVGEWLEQVVVQRTCVGEPPALAFAALQGNAVALGPEDLSLKKVGCCVHDAQPYSYTPDAKAVRRLRGGGLFQGDPGVTLLTGMPTQRSEIHHRGEPIHCTARGQWRLPEASFGGCGAQVHPRVFQRRAGRSRCRREESSRNCPLRMESRHGSRRRGHTAVHGSQALGLEGFP